MGKPCGCGGNGAEVPPGPVYHYEVEGHPEMGTFEALAEARRAAPSGTPIIPVIPAG